MTRDEITMNFLSNKIKEVSYHKLTDTLTVCVLILENGFTVTGESDYLSPEEYDKEESEARAFDKAQEKIWLLEGYLMKERLYQNKKDSDD